MPMAVARPAPDEFAPFYADYVAKLPVGTDPVQQLSAQLDTVPLTLAQVSESDAGFRYAPGKWSIKEVIGHLCDVERVFAYRLLRIARTDQTPLPGFDEKLYVAASGFDERALGDLVAEWATVRRATMTLVRGLEPRMWERRGTANGSPISARALLYIIPGHVQHHLDVLRTRYSVSEIDAGTFNG